LFIVPLFFRGLDPFRRVRDGLPLELSFGEVLLLGVVIPLFFVPLPAVPGVDGVAVGAVGSVGLPLFGTVELGGTVVSPAFGGGVGVPGVLLSTEPGD
jgi:hypothetical protein